MKITLILALLSLVACNGKGGTKPVTPPVPEIVVAAIVTEPTDPGLTICDGSTVLQATFICERTDTNVVVSDSLCNVDPTSLDRTFQSPAGVISVPVANGNIARACALGATAGTDTITCNSGFADVAGICTKTTLTQGLTISNDVPSDVLTYGRIIVGIGPFIITTSGVRMTKNIGVIVPGSSDMVAPWVNNLSSSSRYSTVSLTHYALAVNLPNKLKILSGVDNTLVEIPTVKNYPALVPAAVAQTIFGLAKLGTKWVAAIRFGTPSGFDFVLQDNPVSLDNVSLSNFGNFLGGANAYTWTTSDGKIMRMLPDLTTQEIVNGYGTNFNVTTGTRSLVGSSENLITHVTPDGTTFSKLTYSETGPTTNLVAADGAIKPILDTVKQFAVITDGNWKVINEYGTIMFASDVEVLTASVRDHQDASRAILSAGFNTVISGVNKTSFVTRDVATRTSKFFHIDRPVDLTSFVISRTGGVNDYLVTSSSDALRVFKIAAPSYSSAVEIASLPTIGTSTIQATSSGFVVLSGSTLVAYKYNGDNVLGASDPLAVPGMDSTKFRFMRPSNGKNFLLQYQTATSDNRLYQFEID